MRKGKSDLTKAERLEIGILIAKGYSCRSIAKVLGRGKSTIAYEVKAGSVRGIYDPRKAQGKAGVRKHYRRFQWRKIEESPALKRHIVEKLKAHWNPDEIAGEMRRGGYSFYASKTAIYEWLRGARGQRYCMYLYSRRYRRKPRRKKAKREMIKNRVAIQERFLGATHRTRYGHYERDTVVGRKGTRGGIAVLYERKARLVRAVRVTSMRPAEHAYADTRLLSGLRALSVTRDNGLENRYHERLNVPSFFCRPYASWQKGGVENANKMIRRYFPKGTDFHQVPQREVDRVVSIINNKPRKSLGYRSALEVAQKAGIMINTSVLTEG